MGSPASVCTEKCRPDSCRCGVPAAPCRDTCKKGHCECPKRPPPAAHPCNCPGMQKDMQRAGMTPVVLVVGQDCGSRCGAPMGFRVRHGPNLAVPPQDLRPPNFVHP
jgi:hypothetical protein